MTKHKKYVVILISSGSIIQDLHFGSFSRNCEICENSTTAIISVYQRIFSVATKHAGPLIMGFDQHIISDQLLSDITFHPFSFKLDKLNLLIFGIEKSNNPEWNYSGKGYKSSFIWNYQNSRALFVRKFKNKKAIVRIYQATQEVAMFKNTSPNTVWQQIGILSQYTGLELFGLTHKITCEAIKEIPSCTSLDWNNEIFEKIYSKEQVIEKREWRAWKALLNHSGCTEITPYSKKQSDFEFWTRSENPDYDKTILKNLYQLKFLHPIPFDYQNDGSKLWIAIQDALDNNLRGPNGTQRILSIVANKFTYNKIQANLKVSTDAITYACRFAQNYGPGGHQWKKPIIRHEKMDSKKKELLEKFFQDKAVVIMSSYKMDNSTNQPVHYLKNTKQVLWDKFHETFPDSVKRTSFYGYLRGNRFVYRENLCGLCSICSIHGLFRFIDNIKRNTDLSISGEIEELKDHLLCYLSHQMRKAYLNTQFNANLLKLDNEGAVLVVDYKMKILPKSARETKQEFFGKKGWTLHSVLISHAINRYVKLGFNLSQGTDIESAIKGIIGTQVAHLEPNRTKSM
ncbi:hypothetical protein C2G38_2233314 [Gigaspora rosea]|uniref:Uncharacterized protein n=1 Tax=Gigaspora rosea TaxID=44941 RepID=A0A397TUY2_9GLOM|nr:hypothetical protein C2G38_2233314 [Gigaspora rosea]